MAAELFSIHCTACKSRLKVRHRSAIGQILICPKCQSMVQVTPPPGWVPPDPNAKPASDSAAAPAPATGSTSPAPASAAQGAASVAANSAAPPTEAEMAYALRERSPATWWAYLIAVLALITVGTFAFLIYDAAGTPSVADRERASTADTLSATSDPAATAGAATPDSTASPTSTAATTPGEATAAATAATSEATAAATGEAPLPAGTAPEATTPVGTAPSVEPTSATPAETGESALPPQPMGVPTPIETGPKAELPTAMPARPGDAPQPAVDPMPPLPPAVAGLPAVDVEARLADRVLQIEFRETALADCIDFVSRMSTLDITLDVESLAEVGVTPADPISFKNNDVAVADLLEAILAPRNLTYLVQRNQLLVVSQNRSEGTVSPATYAIEDLTKNDEAEAKRIEKYVRVLVAPESWANDPQVKLSITPAALVVEHHPTGHLAIQELLERLRLARGLALSNRSWVERYKAEPRYLAIQPALDKEVTANFKEATLASIISYLERRSEVNLLVDSLALGKVGLSTDTTTTVVATKAEPLRQVLSRLLEPLELDARVVDGRTLQITTRQAILARQQLELYLVSDLVPAKFTGDDLVARIAAEVDPTSWQGPGKPGLLFDSASGYLLVRQSQPAHIQLYDWLETIRAPTQPAPPAVEPAAQK